MNNNEYKEMLSRLTTRELCSRFMKACSNGEVSLVSYMLDDQQINDVLKNTYHGSSFFTAYHNGQLEVIKTMINHHNHLNINKINIFQNNTIPVKNADEIIKFLLEDDKYPLDIFPALDHAFKYGVTKVAKHILTSKKVIEANKNNTEDNLLIIENKGINLNALLVYSCEKNHADMVKFLLTDKDLVKHPNIHVANDSTLKFACQHNNSDLVKFLLTDPNLTEHADIHVDNDFVLNMACHHGNLELVKFLLTDKNLKEHIDIHNQEDSPFLNACKARVKYVTTGIRGAEEIFKPKTGYLNPQMMDVIKYLTTSAELKEHANINAQDDYALILAFQHDDVELVKYLLTEPKLNGKIDVFKHISELKKAHFQLWEDNLCEDEEDLEKGEEYDSYNEGFYNAKVLTYLITDYGLASHDPKINMEIDSILENLPNLRKLHQYHVLQRDMEVNAGKNKTPKI